MGDVAQHERRGALLGERRDQRVAHGLRTAVQARPEGRRLHGLGQRARVEQGVAQVRGVEPACAARPRPASGPSGVPPAAAGRPSAPARRTRRRARPRSRRWPGSRLAGAAVSRPRLTRSRTRPTAAARSAAGRPGRAGAAPRRPRRRTGTASPRTTRSAGAGRTRTVTAVITPRAPSEPRNSWRRSGPAAERGARPRSIVPARRRHPQPDDHLVEAAVAGGVLAAGAGRGEPADRRVLERLGEVAEREPVLAQQPLGVRCPHPGLQRRDPRHRVDRDEPVHPARSRATTAAKPARAGASPPTTEVPPPKGTTATRCSRTGPKHCQNLVVRTRAGRPRPGRRRHRAARARRRSIVDFPRVCRSRSSATGRGRAPPRRWPRVHRGRSGRWWEATAGR